MTSDREDAMDDEMIARLREPDFAVRLWGYDRQQVDLLLAELSKRATAAELQPTESEQVSSQLTGVGERVDSILASAAEAANHVREEAIANAAKLTQETEQATEHLRREADAYSKTARREADQYASRVRSETDREVAKLREQSRTEAEAAVAAAEEEADQILRDAQLERGRIEEAIEALRERRELVIASIERMRGSLGSMVGEAEQGTDAFLAGAGGVPIAPLDDPDLAAPVDPVSWEDEPVAIDDSFMDEDAPENGVPVFDVDNLGEGGEGPDEVYEDPEPTAVVDTGDDAFEDLEPTEAFEPETAEQAAEGDEDEGRERT
jgi:ElaB/YqjD/DUF883 family membrane-anchored ribosome-binding protein